MTDQVPNAGAPLTRQQISDAGDNLRWRCARGGMPTSGAPLTRQQISDAVDTLGWRYAVGVIRTSVRVGALAVAADVARVVTGAAGDADASLSVDLRPDRA